VSIVVSSGTMKQLVAVVCILVAALVLTGAVRTRRDDKYTTRYDNINIDEILASNRLVENYVKCLLDQGRCSPEGAELRCESIIELLFTGTFCA
jgi:Insect pheromone-binding family, A10/OS-D.